MEQLQKDTETSLELLIREKERELRELQAALVHLRGGTAVVTTAEPVSLEYMGKGIVEAAEHLLTEVGRPMSTRELADGLASRGWRTTSNRPVQAIYSTLTNAPKKFRRTEDGEWRLATEQERTPAPAGDVHAGV
jgi:hypothetical protein